MSTIITMLTICFFVSCSEAEVKDPEKQEPIISESCKNLYPPLDTLIATHTAFTRTNYPKRIQIFQADTITEGDIVMLGNSLTEQGGNWSLKLDQPNVKNRGIAGDNSDGLAARLNELICGKPSIVFIMIGTNDLFIGYRAARVARQIDEIGTKLKEELPDTRVIVQTIMPLASGNDKKDKLIAINDSLKEFENRTYELLDTYVHMADGAGDLPPAYTYDGVHLTPDGYAKWVELLKENL